jgi:A/G-specific adenine glycosylase
LFERRAEKGLLGGMTGLPTSEWLQDHESLSRPDFLQNQRRVRSLPKILHSFTHFDLELQGQAIEIEEESMTGKEAFYWVEGDKIKNLAMPTVFKKFVKLMLQDEIKDFQKG